MKEYSNKILKQAHKDSIYHEAHIIKSKLCGCFHCEKIFKKEEINSWTDEGSEKGRTAICPYCGIDSVLDDRYPIEEKTFLSVMNKYWF